MAADVSLLGLTDRLRAKAITVTGVHATDALMTNAPGWQKLDRRADLVRLLLDSKGLRRRVRADRERRQIPEAAHDPAFCPKKRPHASLPFSPAR